MAVVEIRRLSTSHLAGDLKTRDCGGGHDEFLESLGENSDLEEAVRVSSIGSGDMRG